MTTQAAPPARLAIHAISHRITAWILAFILLAFAVGQLVSAVARAEHGGGFGALVWQPIIDAVTFFAVRVVMLGSQPVFVTGDGLEFGDGASARRVPWARVLQVTQLPRYCYRTSSYWSRVYQVQLTSGSTHRFVGRMDVLERMAAVRAGAALRASSERYRAVGSGDADGKAP